MSPTKKRIYLSPPHMGEWEQVYLREAFESNWIAPLGEHVDEFEREVAQYVGSRGAVAVSSGTAAIHLALCLLGVKPNETVFCSTFTFVASANPILYTGAAPVFIDSDPGSWNMSAQALQRALQDAAIQNKLPKAVIVVNLYGQSSDMEAILRLCTQYEVPVIEDAAESLGATYQGKASGSFGEYGVFSFNGNKIITTSGGGMLVSDNLEGLEKARFLATQARDQARHYQHSEIGYNYRLSNLLAAIGRGQLQILDERVARRRQIFAHYQQALKEYAGIAFMPEIPEGRSTRWLTVMTMDEDVCGVSAREMVESLEEENIEARRTWKPMHLQPLYAGQPYYSHERSVSVSDQLFSQGICLPSGSSMTDEDIDRVIDSIKKRLWK
ncbi:DegT/DnrJ/EryC1/StrS family aminotransferase [Brevibacillus sp. 179-C9.3 HS]|uniref:DegT/DnrJ/EryC1/StrS family aminotransferase n=1 Tax=unclassified Brevibacillus TaxID=2684853 RepID=UPI0039A2E5E5